MHNFLQNLKNNIDFYLNQNFCFSRKNYFEENESKEKLYENLLQKESYLFEKYSLDFLKSNSTLQNYLENLYLLDLLDTHLKIDFKNDAKVLDIGCKNWFYANGEHSFFKKYAKNLCLDGIEIDANRLYNNFYSRKEAAKFYIKDLGGTNFIEKDFLNHDKKYDYIIWILPFVFEYPHLKWGLPLKHFQPAKMLEHAYNALNKDGAIFIVNQGEAEYAEQIKLCKELNIEHIPLDKIQSDFFDYKHQRYGLLIQK